MAHGISLGKSKKFTQTSSQTPISEIPPFEPHKASWFELLGIPSFLAAITALFYYPSLYYAFQFDDLANIVKYYSIRDQSFSSLFMISPRWISYWLNTLYYKIAKFDPFYYRLGSITGHIITGIILFYVLLLALNNLKRDSFFRSYASSIATLTAGLFLLHPVETQTVSYVIQSQLEGLSALFILCIIVCFLLLMRVKKLIQPILIALIAILSFFACGTKEITIVAPLLLLMIDWFFVAQGNWQSLRQRWYIHALVSVIVFGSYVYFLKPSYFFNVFRFNIETYNNVGNMLTPEFDQKITPYNYCISQFKVIVHYAWIFIWPFNISVDYDWMLVKSLFSLDCLAPLFLLLTLGLTIFKRLLRNPNDIISFAVLWFFIIILPRSSIIPSTELLVDYKTYLASIGIHFLLAGSIVWILHKHKSSHRIMLFIIVAFLSLIGYITYERNKVWRSPTEFWENIIKNAPQKARAYNNYGVALSEQRKFEEAIKCFSAAIKLDQRYPDPLNNIAVSYAALDKLDNAINATKRAIALQPYYPEGYNNLATYLMQKKDFIQAEAALHRAIQLRAHYGKAYFNLGRVYLELNKKELAWLAFKNCCTKADFDNELGFNSFGSVSLAQEKYDDAIYAYNKVLEYNPHNYEAHFNLANAYFLKKNYQESEQRYLKLSQLTPIDPRVYYNLAETYWALQQYQKALPWYQKAYQNNINAALIELRIAGCLDQLNQPQQAIIVLEQCLKTSKDFEVLQAVNKALTMLKKKLSKN